jgi:undecaprenyl-diphosphatase
MAITRLGLSDPEQTEKPVPLITAALLVSLGVAIGTIVLFAWIANEMGECDTVRFDDNVRSFVHSFASPAMTRFMFAMSWIGATGMMIILAAAVVLFLMKKWNRALGWLLVTMAGATMLEITLKQVFHRARPVAFFGHLPHSYSFPSGHSLFSFCFYGVMAGFINARVRSTWVRIVVWTIAATMAALIGISRIYLGVHYPSDVVAGYLAGAIWVSTMIMVDRVRRTRRGLKIATVADAEPTSR